MRSISAIDPSKYLRSSSICLSHNPHFFSRSTRKILGIVNSPERFDLTKRCLYIGSIDCVLPVMLEIVAVGAIAIVLLLRIPYFLIDSRTGVQSKEKLRL